MIYAERWYMLITILFITKALICIISIVKNCDHKFNHKSYIFIKCWSHKFNNTSINVNIDDDYDVNDNRILHFDSMCYLVF